MRIASDRWLLNSAIAAGCTGLLAMVLLADFLPHPVEPSAPAVADHCTSCHEEAAGSQSSTGPLSYAGLVADTRAYPQRWNCGEWSAFEGWLAILSQLAIAAAYTGIPIVLFFFARRRKDLPSPGLIYLFVAFILACGIGHALDALMFYWPAYRLLGISNLLTATVSWVTLIVAIGVVPKLLALRSPAQLESEVQARTNQLRRQGDALRAAKETADRANDAKSRFLASMSHELRTPLTAIHGFVEEILRTLEEEEDPQRAREAAAVVMRSTDHLIALTNDCLDLSSISAGGISCEKIPTRMQELFEFVSTTFEDRARQTGNALEIHLHDDLPEQLVLDPTRTRQILANLVSNAIKFTERGMVTINAWRDGDRWHTEVRDSGVGIPPESQARIFDEFAQADETTTRKFGGTGLGLAISRKLARIQDGDLVLTSSVANEGSTFRLTLPCVIPQQHERCVANGQADVDLEEPLDLNVLLVDDNAVNQRLIELILERFGCRVSIAGNGLEAVEAVEATLGSAAAPDAILMDTHMPKMDGLEATRILRKQGFDRPIIAISAAARPEDRKSCLEAGCDAHVPKPIRREQLYRSIQELTARAPDSSQ